MQKTVHFIGAKTSKVQMFRAISTPEGLAAWWASSAQGQVKKGETLQLHFAGLTTLKFTYDMIEPDEKLVLTCYDSFKAWDQTQLVWTLEEKEGQVFLTHIHQNIPYGDLESLAYFSTKWTVYLLSLKQYLETGLGTPYPGEAKLYHGD